jgi:carbonic anhydrase
MIEGGASEDNTDFAPILDAISTAAPVPGRSAPWGVGGVNLMNLLPEDFDSKFYTYPGSLTTPPCSQQVTWFVFENFVQLSDAQLELLRDVQTDAVGAQIQHSTFKAAWR